MPMFFNETPISIFTKCDCPTVRKTLAINWWKKKLVVFSPWRNVKRKKSRPCVSFFPSNLLFAHLFDGEPVTHSTTTVCFPRCQRISMLFFRSSSHHCQQQQRATLSNGQQTERKMKTEKITEKSLAWDSSYFSYIVLNTLRNIEKTCERCAIEFSSSPITKSAQHKVLSYENI